MLEKDIAGFGASGRNGGWCSALFPQVARQAGQAARVVARGGERDDRRDAPHGRRGRPSGRGRGHRLRPASSAARWCSPVPQTQLERAKARGRGRAQPGATPRTTSGSSTPTRATAVAAASNVLGATYTPHCARIHPAKLVRGLARVVEARGVAIYEQTEVTAIKPRRVLHRRTARSTRPTSSGRPRASPPTWTV